MAGQPTSRIIEAVTEDIRDVFALNKLRIILVSPEPYDGADKDAVDLLVELLQSNGVRYTSVWQNDIG